MFFDATVFSVNKDLYINIRHKHWLYAYCYIRFSVTDCQQCWDFVTLNKSSLRLTIACWATATVVDVRGERGSGCLYRPQHVLNYNGQQPAQWGTGCRYRIPDNRRPEVQDIFLPPLNQHRLGRQRHVRGCVLVKLRDLLITHVCHTEVAS